MKGKICYGTDLRDFVRPKRIELQWLIKSYNKFPEKDLFFKKGFYRIAGNKKLEKQLGQGMSEKQIRKTWEKELLAFKKIRKKYLIYP